MKIKTFKENSLERCKTLEEAFDAGVESSTLDYIGALADADHFEKEYNKVLEELQKYQVFLNKAFENYNLKVQELLNVSDKLNKIREILN